MIEKNGVESYIVSDCKGFMITHHKNLISSNTDKLIVTFGPRGSGKTMEGFGTSFFLKLGFDTIYVAQEKGSFYQNLSFEQFEEIMAPFLDKKIFTYGHSLGGYCAVYYAGAINAKAISICPKLPPHPSIKTDKYKNIFISHTNINNNRLSDKVPFVVYDPDELLDNIFFNEVILEGYSQVDLFKAYGLGHEDAPRILIRSGVLKKIINTIVVADSLESSFDFKFDPLYNYHKTLRDAVECESKGCLDESFSLLQNSLNVFPTLESIRLSQLFSQKYNVTFDVPKISDGFIRKSYKKMSSDSKYGSFLNPKSMLYMAEFFVSIADYDAALKILDVAMKINPRGLGTKELYNSIKAYVES